MIKEKAAAVAEVGAVEVDAEESQQRQAPSASSSPPQPPSLPPTTAPATDGEELICLNKKGLNSEENGKPANDKDDPQRTTSAPPPPPFIVSSGGGGGAGGGDCDGVAKMLAFLSDGSSVGNGDPFKQKANADEANDDINNNSHITCNNNGAEAGVEAIGVDEAKAHVATSNDGDDDNTCASVDVDGGRNRPSGPPDSTNAGNTAPANTLTKPTHAADANGAPAAASSVPRRVPSDTQPHSQSALTAANAAAGRARPPRRDRKAKVTDVYVMLTDAPLGSGAFATVYKAYAKPTPTCGPSPPASLSSTPTPSACTAPTPSQAYEQQMRSAITATAGPFYAVKVLDKTRLMGQSLKDEDAQYFAALVQRGSAKSRAKAMVQSKAKGTATAPNSSVSHSPRRFAFSGDAANTSATYDDVVEDCGEDNEEEEDEPTEVKDARALRQLMAMDSEEDEDDEEDDEEGEGEGSSNDDDNAVAVVDERGVAGAVKVKGGGRQAGHKRPRSPTQQQQQQQQQKENALSSSDLSSTPSAVLIRRRRARAGALEARHEALVASLSADTRQRYERYLKEKLRWRREVMILRSVAHANVIRTLDVFDTDASLSLVLELAEGGNLYGLITDGGSLPELVAKVVVYQLLRGVQHLHHHGIVHRDIKLENLLLGRPFTVASFVAASRLVEEEQKARAKARGVTKTGMPPPSATDVGGLFLFGGGNGGGGAAAAAGGFFGTSLLNTPINDTCTIKSKTGPHDITALPPVDLWPEVKITDFGLSRMLGEGTTTMQTMCGTPIYAAPEVTIVKLREDADSGYTAAVDIYSIGVVAFALLTARPPFPHPKDSCGRDIKSRIMYEKPLTWQRKSAYGSAITPVTEAGKALVAGMLALRPRERLTAEEAMRHEWFAEVRAMLSE